MDCFIIHWSSVFRLLTSVCLLLVSLLQGVSCAEADEQESAATEGSVMVARLIMAWEVRHAASSEESALIQAVFILFAIFEETTLCVGADAHSENDCDC